MTKLAETKIASLDRDLDRLIALRDEIAGSENDLLIAAIDNSLAYLRSCFLQAMYEKQWEEAIDNQPVA